MKTVIISQARMTSSRLPGKILKEVLNKPLLAYQIERLLKVRSAESVIVATTVNITDDPVENLCRRYGIKCFRGSEDDVLSRYYHAATIADADVVVRVTSDCPLIDPNVVNDVIAYYKDNKYDYVSNTLTRTFPRGMDTEVFSYKALAEAHCEASNGHEREHVTPFIYKRVERYKLGEVCSSEDHSSFRWTVDTAEDFKLIRNILEYVYPVHPNFTMQDCLEAYKLNPWWHQINEHVEQKKT